MEARNYCVVCIIIGLGYKNYLRCEIEAYNAVWKVYHKILAWFPKEKTGLFRSKDGLQRSNRGAKVSFGCRGQHGRIGRMTCHKQ